MKLTNDATVQLHTLFALNYKLALHVLAQLPEQEEPVGVIVAMTTAQAALNRTAKDQDYAEFITVDGKDQLHWAREYSSHKHNLELTILRAIKQTLSESSQYAECHVLLCTGAGRFLEGNIAHMQAATMIGDAVGQNRHKQMVLNRTKHIVCQELPIVALPMICAVVNPKKVY